MPGYERQAPSAMDLCAQAQNGASAWRSAGSAVAAVDLQTRSARSDRSVSCGLISTTVAPRLRANCGSPAAGYTIPEVPMSNIRSQFCECATA